MLPEISLAKGACTLWEEELLLDYTIEVEDDRFKVHKVVMASVSDYFKAMLTGGMVESREERVRLEGLSSLAVRNVIEFVYTGQFGSSKASTEERLACAVYLQIPSAIIACTASLCEEVNTDNCFHLLSIFKSYGNEDGIEQTVKFIKRNIDTIVYYCTPEEMSYDEFVSLMGFWKRSDWDLFVIAKQWLQADNGRRKDHINDIMTQIRFCLMSPTELRCIRDVYMFSDSDGPWRDLIEKALVYHKLPTHQKVLDESEQTKVRGDSSPVCFGLPVNSSASLYSLHKDKSWVRHDTINPPPFIKVMTKPFVEVNNFVIVSSNSEVHEPKFFIFDPRTLTWSAMASIGVPREDFALVYHETDLYALGGTARTGEETQTTDVIEKYDFQNDSWSTSSHRMPVALSDVQAVSIEGFIYIMGDARIEDIDDTNRLDCFDPSSERWEEKAAPPNVYTDVVALQLDGEVVLAGFNYSFKLCYYKPSTNQWAQYVTPVPHNRVAHVELRVLATGNSLYLLSFVRESRIGGQKAWTRRCSEKWTFGQNGLEIDAGLDDFPLGKYDFCALLPLTPPSLKGK